MGTEFLQRVRPTIEKSIDAERAALSTPDLFQKTIESNNRTAILENTSDAQVEIGDSLLIDLHSDKLVASKERTIIGHFPNPSKIIIDSVRSSCGTALGTVLVIHRLSKKLEVVFS